MPTKCAALAKLFSWDKISQGLLYFILLYPANKLVYKNAPVFLLDAPLRLKMHRFAPLGVSYHNLHFYPRKTSFVYRTEEVFAIIRFFTKQLICLRYIKNPFNGIAYQIVTSEILTLPPAAGLRMTNL